MRSQPALFRWYRNRFLTTGERCEISVQLTGPGQQVTLMPGVSSLQPNPFSNIRKPPIMKHTPIIATLVLLFSLLSGFSHAQEAAININTADVSTLASLQGIGEGKAQAIVEYRRVLQLDPNSVTGNFYLGLMLAGRGDVEQALPYFRKTTEVKPDWAAGQFNLAMALAEVDQAEQAVVHLQETLRLRPVDLTTQIRLTWTLAAHPDPRFRNAEQAVYWGQYVCEATKNKLPGALDALAAAYAEQGDFDRAVTTLHQAVERVLAVKQDANTQEMEHRLQLYQNGEPYRSSR